LMIQLNQMRLSQSNKTTTTKDETTTTDLNLKATLGFQLVVKEVLIDKSYKSDYLISQNQHVLRVNDILAVTFLGDLYH
jgi:hypothetical protein